MKHIVDLLAYALGKRRSRIIAGEARNMMASSKRKSGKRPAQITVNLPDEIVLSLRNPESAAKHRVAIVAIPKDVEEEMDSRIIRP